MADPNTSDGVSDLDDQAVVGSTDEVDVSDDSSGSRYVARVDGDLAGFLDYRIRDGRVVLLHTEVDDAFQGRGVASTLVRKVLDDISAGEREVVVKCEYVQSWLQRHPDYRELLAPQA
ncbi:MAG TPA: GNAT family N-acetyltransferase [Segeticoccus sp.]|jgi:predicted GNAT family acetyltransferase|nr:GNAT family N-acetyltransferase [Segeticoccus sp.]